MEYALRIILFVTILALFYWAADMLNPRDDSDPPGARSNLVIYKDHLTGCEYLRHWWFGSAITPRMDASGKQVCRK